MRKIGWISGAESFRGSGRFLTSPRLRGEVGSHRRCDPGEGVQVYRERNTTERGPSPQPSPREGRGEGGQAVCSPYSASLTTSPAAPPAPLAASRSAAAAPKTT